MLGVDFWNETMNEPWRLDPETWRSERDRLRAIVDAVRTDEGIPEAYRPVWKTYYELTANPPAAVVAAEIGRADPLTSDPEIARLLPLFPAEDVRFVRSIRIEAWPGEIQSLLGRLGAGGSVIHGWAAGGNLVLWSGFRGAPERSGVGEPGQLDTLAHEIGHTIFDALPDAIRDRWEAEIHPKGNGILFAQHADRIGEWNPTGYASETPAEDFAECYRLLRFGGIDTYLRWPVNGKIPGEPAVVGPMRRVIFTDVAAWLRGPAIGQAATAKAQRPPRL